MYPEFTIEPFGRYDRKQQQSLLNINGTGTLQSGTEVETASYTGSRSNVFTAGENEIVTLSLIDSFDPGVNQSNLLYPLNTESNSVTQEIANRYSWPTGDMDNGSLPDGWSYTEGSGSSDSQTAVAGSMNNNTGDRVYFSGGTTSITINVTSLPASGTMTPRLTIAFTSEFVDSVTRVTFPEITTTGTHTASANNFSNNLFCEDGDSIYFSLAELTLANQGFTYTIENIQLNRGSVSTTAYNLDLDTTDIVFNGDVIGSFATNATATAGVTAMALASTTMFSTITSGSVYDNLIPDTKNGFIFGSRSQSGNLPSTSWDLRSTASNLGATVEYATWSDWVGNFFGWGGGSSPDLSALSDLIISEGNQSNIRMTFRSLADSTITATFDVSAVSTDTSYFYGFSALTAQSGIPPADAIWILSLTGDVGAKSIDLNTNQISNIAQMLIMTLNSGSDIINSVSASDGTDGNGMASTYTVTDPYGAEITTFTSSVLSATDSDVATVIQTIVSAINSNIEMPIDFMATSTSEDITITAQSAGSIPGTWSITTNHHGQVTDNGNIIIDPAVVTSLGTEISILMIGGGLSNVVSVNGTSFTPTQIVSSLTNALTSGASAYQDPNADFAIISDDFAEQSSLDIIVSGDTNNELTFETSTKYWGHT